MTERCGKKFINVKFLGQSYFTNDKSKKFGNAIYKKKGCGMIS